MMLTQRSSVKRNGTERENWQGNVTLVLIVRCQVCLLQGEPGKRSPGLPHADDPSSQTFEL